MLIASDRHRPEDLRLWRELEAADLIHGRSAALARKVERSLEAVREFAAVGPASCSVSWGKDSVALAHLVLSVAPRTPLVHVRVTPSHSPGCDDVRDAFLALHPTAEYHEIPADYGAVYSSGLSEEERDRLTDKVFFAAFAEADRRFGGRSFRGVRADESGVRKLSLRHLGLATDKACRPLGWWSVADVFGYLAANNLPVHPNYAMLGGGRWRRESLRVAEIGDTHGTQRGRGEWELEYWGDVVRRIQAGRHARR